MFSVTLSQINSNNNKMKKRKGTRRLTKNTIQGVYTLYFINKVTIMITFCTIYVSQLQIFTLQDLLQYNYKFRFKKLPLRLADGMGF